jgi:glycosyltransferase involved in cell wall biosynthesis
MSVVWTDDRYGGRHGIGRYSDEVMSRLTVDTVQLRVPHRVASGIDAVRGGVRMRRGDILYSPGFAAFASPARQFLTLHDLIHLGHRWPGRTKYLAYYNLLVRPVVKRAGAVFTVSETSAHLIRDWLRDDSVRVVNTGNACSDVFNPHGSARKSAVPALLFVGNLRPHKNAALAFSILKHLPDFRLRVLVPQAEVSKARVLASSIGVLQRVDFLPSLADFELAEEYRGAAATIMPSSVEGFGFPALESVCCGTPVVYWEGCPAIAEASMGRGHAVPTLADPRSWAEVVEHAASTSVRSSEPQHRSSWDDVAARVDDHLRSVL